MKRFFFAPLLIVIFAGCPRVELPEQAYEGPRTGLDYNQLLCLMEDVEAKTQVANLRVATLEVQYGLIEARQLKVPDPGMYLVDPNLKSE
jgi:hypothetical protein